MMRVMTSLAAACSVMLVSSLARADLPSFLRTENDAIEDGNALLEKGDVKGALAEYDRAARELPESPGVQLNRGLALLKLGELAKAREALLAATAPSADADLRADAYRSLALAFYREGDAAAGKSDHKAAQAAFREAVDAAKRSLRLRPGDPHSAWNLELAARRLREETQKQKEEDEKKKQEQKDQPKQDDQQQQGDQGQDQPSDQDPSQGPADDQKQDGAQDKPKDDAGEKKADDQGAQKPAEAKKPEPPEPAKDAQAKKPNERKPASAQQGEEGKQPEGEAKPIPADVAQALDSLADGEENFERVRARQRAARERRAPEKDW